MGETTILYTCKDRGYRMPVDIEPGRLLEEDEDWIGFKVVSQNLESLSLNRDEEDPDSILEYTLGEETEPRDEAEGDPNVEDQGGIYACRTPGQARRLEKYCKTRRMNPRIFKVEMNGLTVYNERTMVSRTVKLIEEETEDTRFSLGDKVIHEFDGL